MCLQRWFNDMGKSILLNEKFDYNLIKYLSSNQWNAPKLMLIFFFMLIIIFQTFPGM